MRGYTRFEIVFALSIFLALVIYASSLTKQSFTVAKESLNKNNIFQVEQALETLTNSKIDLVKTFPFCTDNWCEVNQAMLANKLLNPKTDPPTEILPVLPKNSRGKLFKLKITSPTDYIIQGESAVSSDQCWIIYSDSSKSNTSNNQPSVCLE